MYGKTEVKMNILPFLHFFAFLVYLYLLRQSYPSREFLDINLKEVVGKKHFYDLLHPQEQEEVKEKSFEAFAKKQPFYKFINQNVHNDGRTVWLSISGVPIVDDQGRLLGYRGADTDITELKEAEERGSLQGQPRQ